MNPRHRLLMLPALCAVVLVMPGCGSGGDDSQVASLAGGSSASTAKATTSSADAEKQALAYVECLRGQGLDVPDPTVDADGNVSMGRPDRAPATSGSGTGGGFDRDAFTKAQETCGEPPEGLTGGFSEADRSAFQDAALAFATCLREQGLDVEDPDFSDQAGGPAGAGGGGPFGDLDQDDPTVVAAQEACQSILTEAGVGAGPRGGS